MKKLKINYVAYIGDFHISLDSIALECEPALSSSYLEPNTGGISANSCIQAIARVLQSTEKRNQLPLSGGGIKVYQE